MNRRDFLLSVGLGYLALPYAVLAEEPGLNQRAQSRGLSFGYAINSFQLVDKIFAEAVIRDAGIIVAENEMKWRETQKKDGPPNYATADRIVNFARQHQMGVRGHTIIWHRKPPAWAEAALSGPDGKKLLLDYTHNIVSHFRGQIKEWDVVNEAVDLGSRTPNGLRNWGPYLENGYDFIADCFRAAHEADPDAMLFYNDFGIEYKRQSAKRDAVLKLLTRLKNQDVPIHCLGIQSHLIAGTDFDERLFRNFLKEVADMGIKIRLTELEVDDKNLDADIALRDAGVADTARQYLNVAFDEPAVIGLLTWGVSDRTMRNVALWQTRADRLAPRRLPLDENFQKKPLWHAIAECFDNARSR